MGATFSPCRTWRYALWRRWSPGPCAVFLLLNPSRADERQDDPTIRRCIGFARSWGRAGVVVLNLFAYRATDPRGLLEAPDPVGPGNDEALRRYLRRRSVGPIVCGWGTQGPGPLGRLVAERAAAVCALACDADLCCLGRTRAGAPRHPLYLRRDTRPGRL